MHVTYSEIHVRQNNPQSQLVALFSVIFSTIFKIFINQSDIYKTSFFKCLRMFLEDNTPQQINHKPGGKKM